MADNIGVTAGSGTVIAADDVGGVLHQRVKVTLGPDGSSSGDVSSSNPMPTVSSAASQTRILDNAGNQIASLDDGAGGKALEIAQAATSFIFSTANVTTTQLASNATYTGTIENVINQQTGSILLTSDQNGTLTVFQYIDAAGLRKVSTFAYTITAGIPFSRAFQLNGNYINFTFKNTGAATTTTLNLNVAYGTLPSVTNLGNGPVSLDEVSGVTMGARPDGFLRAVIDPTTLLFDTFDTLDTTNTWTIGGTVSPTGASGNLTLAPGTTASASSYAKSQPTFTPGASAYLQFAALVQIDASVITGNNRFWGLGIYTTPTSAVPVTNGTVFEIDPTTGSLFGSVYSNSVRTQTVTLIRPTDGAIHRYAIYYKASRAYFELDNIQVGTLPFPNPSVSSLSSVIGSVNGGATVAAAPTLLATLIGVGDTGRNASKIADGTYPWRTSKVSSIGSLQVDAIPVDGNKATYAAGATAIVPAATATDIFTLTGSATKTIRVIRIAVTGSQTTSGQVNMLLLKRSTANTGGTSTAPAAVPFSSNNAAATAVFTSYTANPATLGTVVGSAIRSRKAFVAATTANSDEVIWEFGNRPGQAIVLNGTAQVLAINLNSVTVTGGNFNCSIEWTEE